MAPVRKYKYKKIQIIAKLCLILSKQGLPEFFNIQTNNIHNNREAYPLRPELIESLMYIIRATDDDSSYIQMAVDYLESIDRISRLDCGFATVNLQIK